MGSRFNGPTVTAMASTLISVLVVGIVAAAAIFSVARGAQVVAKGGTAGILAEATLSAAAATHNAVTQAQIVAEAEHLEVATSSDRAASLTRIEEALVELEQRTGQTLAEIDDDATRALVNQQSTALHDLAAEITAKIQNGELDGSHEAIGTNLRAAYDSLVTTLVALRNDAFSDIAISRDDAGRLADAARFLVVLLVPVTILIAYRSRIRRLQARHELEAELEKEHAVSQTKSHFIAHMSHQLRTPLTSIYGSALELSDPSIGSDAALTHELTSLITEESAELARMVEDILAVAAEDQGQLSVEVRDVDPVLEIEGVLEPFGIVGRATVRRLQAGSIVADPRHFRQVISNLVSNSLRHGLGPTIIEGRIEGSSYVVEVIDHGPGVDPDTEAKLFNRFMHDGDSPLITGSVGLGLAVAEILITRMNGSITYQRRDNTTVFAVRLPLADHEANAPHRPRNGQTPA